MYDNQFRFYAEEAKHRHAVTATALENSTVDVGPGPADVSFFVRASWTDNGSDHVDVVEWADEATVGDRAVIWVDDNTGEPVDPPAPPGRAASDAVGVAFSSGSPLWQPPSAHSDSAASHSPPVHPMGS